MRNLTTTCINIGYALCRNCKAKFVRKMPTLAEEDRQKKQEETIGRVVSLVAAGVAVGTWGVCEIAQHEADVEMVIGNLVGN